MIVIIYNKFSFPQTCIHLHFNLKKQELIFKIICMYVYGIGKKILIQDDNISLTTPKKTIKQYQFNVKLTRMYLLRSYRGDETIIESNYNSAEQKCKDKYYLASIIKISPNPQTRKLQLNFYHPPPSSTSSVMKIKKKENTVQKNKKKQYPMIVVSKEFDSKGQPKGHILNIGDIVLFGRVKYAVRQIKLNGVLKAVDYDNQTYQYRYGQQAQQQLQIQQQINQKQASVDSKRSSRSSNSPRKKSTSPTNQQLNLKQSQRSSQSPQKSLKISDSSPSSEQIQKLQCRICMDSTSTSDDPLISICKCTGSCKYTHFGCLKTWVEMKAVVLVRDWSIVIDRINCQICKSEIPITITLDKQKKESKQLLLIQRPTNINYLMLQKIDGDKKNIIILKNIPYEGVSIGRSAGSYIKIQDVSVSRVHAWIKYNKGQFCVYDNQSKFGTQVIQSRWKQGEKYQQKQGGRGESNQDARLMQKKDEGQSVLLRIDVGKVQRFVQIGRNLIGVVVKKKKAILTQIQ